MAKRLSEAGNVRARWGSSAGFVWTAAGSAVGLGTIWKFPGKAYEGGGGLFCLVYLAVAVLLGVGLLLGEFAVGRAAQKNAAAAFRSLGRECAGRSWAFAGHLGLLSSLAVLLYYVEVGGWVLAYVLGYLTEPGAILGDPGGAFARLVGGPGDFPWLGAVWSPLAFTLATVLILRGGLNSGVERFNRLVMPGLLLVMAVLALAVQALPGAGAGAAFLLRADWRGFDFDLVLSALGQCFFSLSLGMSVMVTYGSFLPPRGSLPGNAWAVCLVDTLVAFLSGLIVVPAVFATPGAAMGKGGSFAFTALSGVFARMPGGLYVGLLFYLLLLAAALTSSVSLLETLVTFCAEEWGWRRARSLWGLGGFLFLAGMGYTLSYGGFWPGPLAAGLEWLADRLLIPLAALAACLFVGWVWGPERALGEICRGSRFPGKRLWVWLIRWFAPAAILLILGFGFFA